MRKSIFGVFAAAFMALLLSCNVYAISDIDGHWAAATIREWVDKGYISGYEDGSFRPDGNITRAEFAALAARAFDIQRASLINFSDVSQDDWFYDAVSKGVGSGYISGYDDNTFRPHNNITREEAAVILSGIMGESQSPDYANNFTDSHLLSWSKGYVGACVRSGVLRGDTGGTFRPGDNMTRAEAVTALNAALKASTTNTNTGVGGGNSAGSTQGSGGATDSGNNNRRNDVTINTKSYGPTSGTQSVDGTVYITNANGTTTVQNLDISGDLVVESSVKKLVLDGVTVSGKTTLNGGTTVELNDCNISDLYIDKSSGSVTVENKYRSYVKRTTMRSGATLKDSYDSSSYGFGYVLIPDDNVKKGASFSLYGDFEEVTIEAERVYVYLKEGAIELLELTSSAKDSQINLDSGTTVEKARIYARNASILGSGRVKNAAVNASGVTLARKPNTLTGSYDPSYGSSSSADNDKSRDYTYTVKVVNNSGAPVQDVSVRIDGTTKTTGANGTVYFYLDYGSYDYRITRDGFYTESGTVRITGNRTETYTLRYSSRYNVTVNVTSGNAPVENAKVVLSNVNTSLYTDNNGRVQFTNIEPGYYTGTITKDGYASDIFAVEVYSANTVYNRTLTPNAVDITIRFYATGDNEKLNMLAGVPITAKIDNTTLPESETGFVTVTGVSQGDHRLSVTAEGYQPITNRNITVNASNTVFDIFLEPVVVQKGALKFNITDPLGVSVTASISLQGSDIPIEPKTSDTSPIVFEELTPGVYGYELTAGEDYEPLTGSATVTAGATKTVDNVSFVPKVPEYTVTLQVYYMEGEAKRPLNAQITVTDTNDPEYTKSAVSTNGTATFDLRDGAYSATATVDGYNAEPKTFTIDGAQQKIDIEMTAIQGGAPENIAGDVPQGLGIGLEVTGSNEEPVVVSPVMKPAAPILEKNVEKEQPAPAVTVEEPDSPQHPVEEKVTVPEKPEKPQVEEKVVPVVEKGSVTFYVSGLDYGSRGTVTVAGKSATVSSGGTVTISGIDYGTYTYTVSANGYETVSGTVTVSGNVSLSAGLNRLNIIAEYPENLPTIVVPVEMPEETAAD